MLNPRAPAVPQVLTVLATALTLLPVLAADARAQLLLAVDGVELHGTVRRIMPGAGTCNVLETDTSYETKKANHGAPMDVWRLDFSVRNGSGRWLDHLIARYEVESKWPDCTNWSGPDDTRFRELNSDVPLHELTVGWSGTIGSIQESGRNVVQPGQTLTTTEFVIVLSADPEPRFSNWSTDFDFAVAPPPPDAGLPAAAPAATAEQETVFWQSIADSENPAMFRAYLDQLDRSRTELCNVGSPDRQVPDDLVVELPLPIDVRWPHRPPRSAADLSLQLLRQAGSGGAEPGRGQTDTRLQCGVRGAGGVRAMPGRVA